MERQQPDSLKDDAIGSALKAIEGKWKLPIMYVLCRNQSMRYSELKKALGITNMMLTSTLKELETAELITRTQYNEMPVRVEYAPTSRGRRLMPILKEIRLWGESLNRRRDEAERREGRTGSRGILEGGNDADETGWWRFCRRNGTMVKGVVVTDPESGERTELPRWEWIHGAWWCFDADGNLKTGLFYDSAYRGWFYLDQKNGLKTGWVLIDGEWRYFEPSCPVTEGRMVSDTWIDGWYVNEEGVWDGQSEQQAAPPVPMPAADPGEDLTAFCGLEQVVADARAYRQLTQKELAERTGVNQADISKLEKGTRNPTIAILKRLADGLDMDLCIAFVPKRADEEP